MPKVLGLAAAFMILMGQIGSAQTFSDQLWAAQHSWNGDDATFWMREEAYRASVDVALAKLDQARADDSLVQRDFTHERSIEQHPSPDRLYMLSVFEPCAVPLADLPDHLGPGGASCTASPGAGGTKHDAKCPQAFCVIVSVNEATWADQKARNLIVQTVRDHKLVCLYAGEHGPNLSADAAAAECSGRDTHPVQVDVEIKPRLYSPCVDIPIGKGRAYRPECTNAGARIVELGWVPGVGGK